MTKTLYDFSFGNTPGIRQAMIESCKGLSIRSISCIDMDYPAHDGYPELIKLTKELVFNITGTRYKYLIITSGATHAINAYLYAVKQSNDLVGVVTNKLYYRFYPDAIKAHDLYHRPSEIPEPAINEVLLLDSPSNPQGLIQTGQENKRTIWDMAYYSPTYFGILANPPMPLHEAAAGTFNKFTGLNGLRVGWLATNNIDIYRHAFSYIEGNVCAVSAPAQDIALYILKNANLNKFYRESNKIISSNKEEFSKLGYLFGNQEIPQVGMFALFEIDRKLQELFDKASVRFTPGSTMGDDRKSIRVNLAKTNEETKKMVKEILKKDKR